MEPVRVGVIGAGYWGPNLIRNFYEIPETELKVVCDLNQERLDHINGLYPDVHTTQDIAELLESDVEAVTIATPVSSHYSLAMQCLHAGKHILIEKPMTKSSSEAREILQTSKAVDKVVMTGFTFLFNPAVSALKEIIESGEIGDVYYINGTRVNLGLYQPDVNVIWDLAPHDISLLQYILGMDPESVSSRGGMFVKPGVCDVAYLTLHFPNSVLADLRVSWLDPCKIRRITIVGSKKMVVYDDIEPENKIIIYDKGVEIQPYTDTFEDFHLAYRYGDESPYPLKWEEPLKMECLHFVDSIRNKTSNYSDGVAGLKVVQVLEAAQNSMLNGGVRKEISW
ncbi:Gfo/Idh/MocA family protein [Chloroflexota bacterium]